VQTQLQRSMSVMKTTTNRARKNPQTTSATDYDEENLKPIPTKKPQYQASSWNFSWTIISYMATFFFCMIILDITSEASIKRFSHLAGISSAMTLFQFGYCFFLPMIVTRGKVFETFPRTFQELYPYFKLSTLVFGATFFATQAVQYVSFPTKVVFKSAKLIPTMIVSTFLNRGSKYRAVDYAAALLLCLGAAGFTYASNGGSTKSHNQNYYGVFLLCISITCDALVPNIQQKMMNPPEKKSTVDGEIKKTKQNGLSAPAVMVNVNTIGFVGISLYMLIDGSLLETTRSAYTDPTLLIFLNIVGLSLATAVLAYTRLIKASNSVTAVTVSTFRKIVTISLSYIVFPKPLNQMHIISGAFVLGGVLINSFCKKRY